MLRTLHREQFIPAPPERVWEFFATPKNLDAMTPPNLRFQILSELPERMYTGQLIAYRISPVPGIWLSWLTEIRHVEEGRYFVDEQRAGPYRFWYHEHRFTPVAGGVQMTDHVSYDVGWGPAGALVEKLWVCGQLEGIFNYRAKRVTELFG